MNRVEVNPQLVSWARERAQLSIEALAKRFPKLADWESGELQPTFNQLEDFAAVTHVPFGFLFLPEPPEIPLPITDFRTVQNHNLGTASPELLDTIYAMQRRQAWLREERLEGEAAPLPFVGSANLNDAPRAIGQEMRRLAGLGEGWAAAVGTWREAVGALRTSIENLGVMTVINGVVGNNTHRKLNVSEFRGFALSDEYAPLIFVNGSDSKSAQMFTLAHELAHIWLGEIGSGLSGFEGIFPDGGAVEEFCDRAAAEFLVPEEEVHDIWVTARRTESPFETLARHFKVSPIVTGRRVMDLRLVERQVFFEFYEEYTQRERIQQRKSSGGDFYRNQNARVGELFARRVIYAAKEGRIGFKRAYDLTDLKGAAFQKYASRLGIALP